MNDAVSALIIKEMDLAAARHKVLAHGLANYGVNGTVANTAGFEGELDTAEKRAAGEAVGAVPAAGAEGAASSGASAGGTPAAEELEMQLARLADNTGRFSALARVLSIRDRVYETAIKGR